MPKLTFLPITMNSQNRIQLTEDPAAELDLLLMQPPKSRTFDKKYGVDMSYLQQTSSDPSVYIPIFSLELKEKLSKYTKHINLQRAEVFKNPDENRTIYIEVFWLEQNTTESRIFETPL